LKAFPNILPDVALGGTAASGEEMQAAFIPNFHKTSICGFFQLAAHLETGCG